MSNMNWSIRTKILLGLLPLLLLVVMNYGVSYQPNSWGDELILTIFIAAIVLFYWVLQQVFIKPLSYLTDRISRISEGDYTQCIEYAHNDELGNIADVVDKLAENAQNATTFITNIKDGNLDAEYTKSRASSDEQKDGLAGTLIGLRDHMKTIAEQERERNWATEGLAKFVYILRANNEEITTLGDKIITNLVKYVNANQGGLFVVNQEEDTTYLELVSCYAFDRKKFIQRKIQPGEGMVGQAYLEKDTIYLTEIPDDYITITSGLGLANPSCILIVPLKVNDQILGVVELASFHTFPTYQIAFIEKLGESIASTISNAKVNERTKRLLEESQEQSEEMRAQEEEMRQNMEELHATQEDLQRKNIERQQAEKELMRAQSYLNSIINKIGNPILVKDRKHRLILINDAFCEFAGMKREQMLNKSDHDLFPKEQADIFYAMDEVVFNSGEDNINVETNTDSHGVERTVVTKKTVFKDESGETFLVATVTDISDTRQLENVLSQEKTMLDTLMDSLQEMVAFKDASGRFLKANKALADKFKIPQKEEIAGKTVFDYLPKEQAEILSSKEQEVITTGKTVESEERLILPDGSDTSGVSSQIPFKDTKGNISGTLHIFKQ
ncbi:PAS domain-containing protein [Rhodocytophaga rosea]|uniref:PAS domain-containing protein n=1 Tax=Rhodocytophaga rosea TaxID=2704465 RepID=A0A6C0GSM0_9BACT|nr:PAS domain-containing protein [Rhodocytophaga rosea]QHT71125.1 PAS domain-containing protein [Rhodocytophaga rosea]